MDPILAVFGLGGGELMLVMAAVLILFGAKKIPDFAKGLGQGIKEFKKASREVQDEIERATDEHAYTPPPTYPPPAAEPRIEPASVTPVQLPYEGAPPAEAKSLEYSPHSAESPATASTTPKV